MESRLAQYASSGSLGGHTRPTAGTNVTKHPERLLMAKKRRRVPGARQTPGKRRPRAAPRDDFRARPGELDHTERIALVCKYFCQGHQPGQIQDLLLNNHGIRVAREIPYRYLAYAAKHGWIRFVPPPEHTLADDLKLRYPWIEGAAVVHTAVYDDVALQGAEMLMDLLRIRGRVASKSELHVGFAGGHVMRRVAERFAGLLRQPAEGLPKTLVFHSLVAGFDVEVPSTAPNAFFTYFVNDPAMQVETRFVGLHASPLVKTKDFPALLESPGIEEAVKKKAALDVIVTSVGSLSTSCNHSMLLKYLQKSKPSLELLREQGYRGDMLWRPIGLGGPITTETEIRAMTLMELDDLATFIGDGKAVLLVVGPCRVCNEPRTEILETILGFTEHLITHVVADSRSVAGLMQRR